jgi:hypothetical protein
MSFFMSSFLVTKLLIDIEKEKSVELSQKRLQIASETVLKYVYLHSRFFNLSNALLMLKVFLDAHSKSKLLPTLFVQGEGEEEDREGQKVMEEGERLSGSQLQEVCSKSLKSFHTLTASVYK